MHWRRIFENAPAQRAEENTFQRLSAALYCPTKPPVNVSALPSIAPPNHLSMSQCCPLLPHQTTCQCISAALYCPPNHLSMYQRCPLLPHQTTCQCISAAVYCPAISHTLSFIHSFLSIYKHEWNWYSIDRLSYNIMVILISKCTAAAINWPYRKALPLIYV